MDKKSPPGTVVGSVEVVGATLTITGDRSRLEEQLLSDLRLVSSGRVKSAELADPGHVKAGGGREIPSSGGSTSGAGAATVYYVKSEQDASTLDLAESPNDPTEDELQDDERIPFVLTGPARLLVLVNEPWAKVARLAGRTEARAERMILELRTLERVVRDPQATMYSRGHFQGRANAYDAMVADLRGLARELAYGGAF